MSGSASTVWTTALVGLQDVMPTLLDLAGIDRPETVAGRSMVSDEKRDHLFCEYSEGARASRMLRQGRYKLIYYPIGNRTQLFDLHDDPEELVDLSESADHTPERERLTHAMMEEFHGSDLDLVKDGVLVGAADLEYESKPNRGLSTQRGGHWLP